GRERRELEERTAGIDEPVDPFSRGQLAPLAVPRQSLLAASARDLPRPLPQLGDEPFHPGAPGLERVGTSLRLAREQRHERSLGVRKDELEEVAARALEASPPVEVESAAIVGLDHDLQSQHAFRDREALDVLDELAADALVLVVRADEELLDTDDVAVAAKGHIAGLVVLQ